jgi:hypothetical protein
MIVTHILNGDCLADQLRPTKMNQHFIVCRECLIEGDVVAANITEFWEIRARYFADSYSVSNDEYYSKTVNELEKLNNIPDNSEVCLWFENDLFCQVNMWFVISILSNNRTLKVCRIFPVIDDYSDVWKGFGRADVHQLQQAYDSKIQFTSGDIKLGKNLWMAFQNGNLEKLKHLSKSQSNCFGVLDEVCQAHIDRFPEDQSSGRPERLIQELIQTHSTDFNKVFSEFSEREGIYGFGDLQLKTIYDKLMIRR